MRSRLVSGPTGLGSGAARLGRLRPAPPANAETRRPRPPSRPLGGPRGLGTSASRTPTAESGGGAGVTVPPLYEPGPVRVDEELAAAVDERLVAWFRELDIFTDQLDHLRRASWGRLVMLTHPDSDDPDQLMLAARWAVALWAVDDVYVDDERAGADPEQVARRLALAVATLEPPPLLEPYAGQLDEAMGADPVRIALRSSLDWVARSATRSQVARARHEAANTFGMWNAKAAWRATDHVPAVWEYLSLRQIDDFVPCIALIDVVGGYELPANVYSEPRVRRATTLAGSATVVANDLYSMAKEGDGAGDFNLPTLIAAERQCSPQEAMDISAAYHDDLVRAFEAQYRDLLAEPSPALQRYLLGLRAWIGGSNEWHRRSARYRMGER